MCILKASGIKVSGSEEMKILVEGLKFLKEDYAIGQIVYVCNKFGVNARVNIDYRFYYNKLSEYNYPKNMELANDTVRRRLLEKVTKERPAIIYVDKYYLGEGVV